MTYVQFPETEIPVNTEKLSDKAAKAPIIRRKRMNFFTCTLPAKSVNEGLTRGIIASFCAQLDPTVEELCDMKTAISEAVTNCIVHAYAGETDERKISSVLQQLRHDIRRTHIQTDPRLRLRHRRRGSCHAAHVFRCEQRGTQRYGIFDHAVLYG